MKILRSVLARCAIFVMHIGLMLMIGWLVLFAWMLIGELLW